MTPVHIVHETAQSSPQGRPGLQAGSVVQARVIQTLGGGNYVISLAGQTVSVRSEIPLQQGAVFSAKIDVRGEQVVLSLVGKENAQPLVTQFFSASAQDGLSPQLAHLLASLGLSAESEAFRLLQFAQAMGMKIDPRQMRKALQAAGRDGGGEDASQTALVLDEKGIEANADALAAVTDGMAGGGRNGGNQRNGNGGKNHPDEDSEGRQKMQGASVPDSVDDFAFATDVSSTDIKAYFSSVDRAASQNEIGALTLFNSFRGGENSQDIARWMVLPFEWTLGYQGEIRILPEKNQKNVREIIINAKNLHTNWHFVVYCKQGKIDSVRFSRIPMVSDKAELTDRLKKMLVPSFGSLKSVEYVAELDGWCAQDKAIGTVGGLV